MAEKTKATDATGQPTVTDLKQFLSSLATDAHKLGEFLHEPEAGMSAANLSEADKAALRSGVAGMIAARLAGMPLDKAFNLIAQVFWIVGTPQPQWMPAAHQAAYMHLVPEAEPASKSLHWMVQPPPQYVVYPPQYVVQPPPQYVVYPPQYVVQPPPQYVVYPPQFVVQPPPYYPR